MSLVMIKAIAIAVLGMGDWIMLLGIMAFAENSDSEGWMVYTVFAWILGLICGLVAIVGICTQTTAFEVGEVLACFFGGAVAYSAPAILFGLAGVAYAIFRFAPSLAFWRPSPAMREWQAAYDKTLRDVYSYPTERMGDSCFAALGEKLQVLQANKPKR